MTSMSEGERRANRRFDAGFTFETAPAPRNGIDRCECGCKYWTEGCCVDCGEIFRPTL